MALDTLFSSGRTGSAPPGPGGLALPLLEDDGMLSLAAGVLLADALSVPARTPPMIAPARARRSSDSSGTTAPPGVAARSAAISLASLMFE